MSPGPDVFIAEGAPGHATCFVFLQDKNIRMDLMLTPAGVLLVWLRGLIAIGIFAGAGWLLYRWSEEARGYEPVPVVATDPVSPAPQDPSDTTPEPRRSELKDWRPGWDKPTALLAGALGLLLLSAGGRFLGPRLLLKSGPAVPALEGGQQHWLTRPDGTKLKIEVFGAAGPTIVATHGWGTDRQEWVYLQRAVAGEWRLIVWDMPGSGESTRPNNDDYSLEKFAHDLRAVVELAGNHPVVLAGHSIGGMTTLTFCRLFPAWLGARVVGLILAHTTYRNPIRTMWGSRFLSAIETPVIVPLLYLQIALSPLMWLSNCLSYWNGSMHWSNSATGFGGTETRQQLDFISSYTLTASPAVVARGCLGMLKYDAEATLSQIPVPVLVVSGEQDPITPTDANLKISARVQSGWCRRLSPAKHYGFFEHDEVFANAVKDLCRTALAQPQVSTAPVAAAR